MTDIPLHHPVFSPTDLPTLRVQLKERAVLAYTMFALSALAATKRTMRLPDGVVPGFRASFVNGRLEAAGIEGRVTDQPNRRERRKARHQIKAHWKRVHDNDYRKAIGLAPITE